MVGPAKIHTGIMQKNEKMNDVYLIVPGPQVSFRATKGRAQRPYSIREDTYGANPRDWKLLNVAIRIVRRYPLYMRWH